MAALAGALAQTAGYQQVFYHVDPLSDGSHVLTEVYAIAKPSGP